MENNIHSEHPLSLSLDREAISYLEETRKWAHFLSIVGFIGVGIMLILGLFIGGAMDTITAMYPMLGSMRFLSIIYFLVAIFYLFPVLYTYRFSVSMKNAIREIDNSKLNNSFSNLKSLFKFMGILMIIVLSLYAIIIITAIIVALAHR